MIDKNTQIEELIITTAGVPELGAAREKLVAVKAGIDELRDAFNRGAIHNAHYKTSLKELNAEADRLARGLKATADGAAKSGADWTSKYRVNLIGLSYVLNDFFSVQGGFQQKMMAIGNNMPMLAAGLGGIGYALGAILPILGAVSGSVVSMWKNFFGADYETAKAKIAALRKSVQEWEETPPVLPLDVSAFERARKELEALEDAASAFERNRKTAEQLDIAGRASTAVRETIGSEALAKSIAQAATQLGVTMARDQDKDALSQLKGAQAKAIAAADRPMGEKSPLEMLTERKRLADFASKIAALETSIAGQHQAKAVAMAGEFAAGDVHGIGQVQGLIDRVPMVFNRDFVDQAITLPGNAAEVVASREDAKARAIEEEQAERLKAIDRGIERTEQENQARAQRQREIAERLHSAAAAATERVQRVAGDDLKKAVLAGLAAGKPEAAIQRDVMAVASKVAMADDLIRPDLKNVAAFRAGNDAIEAERNRIDLPNVPQLPQRPKRRTLEDRRNAAHARLAAEAARKAKLKAQRQQREADRKASIKAGIKPGTPAPLAPERVAAQNDLLQIQAKDAREAQAQAPAGLNAQADLQRFLAESQQTVAVLTAQINELWAMFGGAARGQIALRRNAINQLQAERTRTMSMLPGAN